MITDKKKELLESTYDKVIHVGFCLIPYEDLSSIFAKDMIAFGTTKDELIRSFDEMDALFKSQFEQMGDIVPEIKRERIATQFSSDENQVIISEIVAMTMKTEEFTNTLTVRTSAVLDWVKDKWIFVHWHASSPVKTENDHWHFDEWKKENDRLQELVDHQTADLRQKNRDLEIETALERVRARSMAMHNSTELGEVALVLFDQLKSLGGELWGTGFAFCQNDSNVDEFWFANDKVIMPRLNIPNNVDPVHRQMYDGWKNNFASLSIEKGGQELKNHYDYMLTVPDVRPIFTGMLEKGITFPEWQKWYTAYFKNGYLLIITTKNYENEEVFVRFATVFEQAYTRFQDLKVAEEQANIIREERDRLEITLNKLQTTQDQLIQREKLASLGQLTAGIAHEIKNPLNFVNNFSEVSLEMIDEAMEEAKKASDNSHVQETLEILTEIKANLAKIHEHGSRADGIVKSMLMHSRGGSGSMEPTNLNQVVGEYVNLAFHGMRAGKHPINVDIDLDLDDSIGQVPLIAEDFSRVILNLCNNAFDAMRERGDSSKPKLTVRTQRDAEKITIEIEDNGPGIPDDIKDKILQPFFTTKKGTQGTGLGLSITHDIIKAHGGSLDIESILGRGTTLTINLVK
ncbi:MAG TPA: hypothetical protein DCE78_07365 [Bacteroidetes bacterium]|nr:hypothetical protein [Bacteroidota bacterium]